MRKFILSAAAVMLCAFASAQVWVGGTVGYSSESYYRNLDKQNVAILRPQVGYSINQNWDAGGIIEFKNTETHADGNKFNFDVKAFGHWNFFHEGNFHMFLNADLGFGVLSPQGYNQKHLCFEVGPGMKYNVSDHWTLTAMFNGLSFTHYWRGDLDSYAHCQKNQFDLGVSGQALEFGIYYTF